ncbi:MAG: 3-phosphoshikimate 1-carboxyvinyltransferase, partial [Acidimicrobiales bacterium]
MAGASQPIEILASGPLCGVLAAPPSKSVTNRLLVIAALASGTSEIIGPLQSDDTEAMSRGLEALGAGITPLAGGWSVAGTAGRPRPPEAGRVIDAGLSGTTLRFLASVSMLARGTVVIDGAPPLRRRP